MLNASYAKMQENDKGKFSFYKSILLIKISQQVFVCGNIKGDCTLCVVWEWSRPGLTDWGSKVWEENVFGLNQFLIPSSTHCGRMGRLHSSEKHLPLRWMEGSGALNRAAWCGGWGKVSHPPLGDYGWDHACLSKGAQGQRRTTTDFGHVEPRKEAECRQM